MKQLCRHILTIAIVNSLIGCASSKELRERESRAYFDSTSPDYQLRVDGEIESNRTARKNFGYSSIRGKSSGIQFDNLDLRNKETIRRFYIKCQCPNSPNSEAFDIPTPLKGKSIKWRLGQQSGTAVTDREGILDFSSTEEGTTITLDNNGNEYRITIGLSGMILNLQKKDCF